MATAATFPQPLEPVGGRVLLPLLPGWFPWLGFRLVAAVATVLFISLVVFGATQALPSDPARVILGPEATEASVATLRAQLGFDRPFLVQYGDWAARAAAGDFGASLDSGVPAGALIVERFGNSAVLMLLVLLVGVPLSFLLGIALAARRDRAVDRHAMTVLILVKAIPSFILGIGLILVFSTSIFPILPAASLLDPMRSPLAQPLYLILPVVTLLLAILPFLIRLIRASMIEALDADHVVVARLRGVPERRILWRHAVPNALVPTIQGIAMTARMLLGGALIVEVLFSYPGLGTALNAAVEMRDVPVVQGITLVIAVGIVLINLAADVATVMVTPRLRTERRPALRAGTRAVLKLKAGGL